ncbi:ubiquitin domain-containing protein 2-like isoform X1 [Haliotis cracherodii]|uniref:ubiquitin domain-containing protein 2-like isoform X1 n=1 Tax=Haliotis rufescens TaxID=6454 RepID=UPI001EB084FA|nr:ubiquitin domain-containing protein 2-like isoform X1 [Haliotis rufescens]
MGGCIGANRDNGPPSRESSDVTGMVQHVSIGRNQPLKAEKPKWKSDVQLTEGQLRSKRDEFWDTAPAFEGRKEIWDALKAAAYALETGDHALAQAIVDGANISLPHGTLMDCYDELGNRYQLPVYVLSAPTNLIEELSESDNGQDTDNSSPGIEIPIKFRLSHTNKDIKMPVRTTDSVYKIKKRICEDEGIEVVRQRFFYSGRLLNDKLRIEDAKVPKGHVIQVIVTKKEEDL